MASYGVVFAIAVALAAVKGALFYVLCSTKMSRKTSGVVAVVTPAVVLIVMYVLFGVMLKP